MGRVRAVLKVVSERVAFGRLDKTIAAWTARVLAEPDTQLETYSALGAERLAAFAESFEADPLAAVHDVFGLPELERHYELASTMDLRQIDIETEEIDETSDGIEIPADYKEARGVGDGALDEMSEDGKPRCLRPQWKRLQAAEELAAASDAVFDYVVEYTREHLSPVIARALRAYRVRGVAVAATELTITKAPRKTLGAILAFRALPVPSRGRDLRWVRRVATRRRRPSLEDRWIALGDPLAPGRRFGDGVPVDAGTRSRARGAVRARGAARWDFAQPGLLLRGPDRAPFRMGGLVARLRRTHGS